MCILCIYIYYFCFLRGLGSGVDLSEYCPKACRNFQTTRLQYSVPRCRSMVRGFLLAAWFLSGRAAFRECHRLSSRSRGLEAKSTWNDLMLQSRLEWPGSQALRDQYWQMPSKFHGQNMPKCCFEMSLLDAQWHTNTPIPSLSDILASLSSICWVFFSPPFLEVFQRRAPGGPGAGSNILTY